jgi:hypothetical protein
MPILLLAGVVTLAACGGDTSSEADSTGADQAPESSPTPSAGASVDISAEPAVAPATSVVETTAPASPPTSAPAVTTTTEPEIEIPEDVLVAVPTQNREDPAKNQFQIQVHNGTRERFDLSAVQFVWDGYTTPVTERDAIVVGGLVIDFPVPFPGATCVGDGTRETMPTLDDARVVLTLDSGDLLELPVVDKWHVARRLYEEDCERQMIDRLVGIEWVDLHEADFEGRPVTAGELRLTRREGVGAITVLTVADTIPFVFDAVDTERSEPVVTLADGEQEASVPIRFIESRCDPHALAEIKQPTRFVAQIELDDGSVHPYIVYPDRSLWTPMRLTADKACVALGKVEFVGEGSSD